MDGLIVRVPGRREVRNVAWRCYLSLVVKPIALLTERLGRFVIAENNRCRRWLRQDYGLGPAPIRSVTITADGRDGGYVEGEFRDG